jgi:signal transduction histidine kinase
VILGNLSILKLQNGGDKSNLVTETMERSADSLNETISRLLDQAYVQSGKAQLQTSEVCVGDLVQEIANPIQALAKQKFLDFSISVSDSVPKNVMVDRLRVKQILTNLLENAVKYTDTGSISLAMDFHTFGERQLILSVKDTGIGIPRNRIRSMFKPFVQGQSYDTREYGGVGLGLSIVSQLVDLMKGKITVNSIVGAGSTFTVTIPLEA